MIAPSTYYAAKSRPPSARAQRDVALLAHIKRVHKDSGEVYGARKVWLQLRRDGVPAALVHGGAADAPGRAGGGAARPRQADHDPRG